MIIIALVYMLIVSCEVYYLKQRNVSIKPYMMVYSSMFVVSEIMYYLREHFQLIQLIKMVFAPIENIILLK